MKQRFWIAGAAAAALCLPVTLARAVPPTRLDYARKCAQEMGTIPAFSCMNGDIIPITKNGQAVTQATKGEDCDKPVQLGLGGDSQCVPYSRFLRIKTTVPTVETVVICRKYLVNDNGPQDTLFSDIAVVQHNRATGNTCYFQSAVEADLDGTSVPSPQDNSARASQYWLEPSPLGGWGGIVCNSCHDADPFVWSQYIAQVANTNNWNPLGFWNSNYQDLFGRTVSTFRPNGTTCSTCHRIGNRTCHRSNVGDGRVSAREVSDKMWMAPGFSGTRQDWDAMHKASVEKVWDCCDNPADPTCNTKVATEEPDGDMDFVADSIDNCPARANTGQENWDGDPHGNACDNCPFTANASVVDTDNDGRGDVCDNCPTVPNPDQLNTDGDTEGDACDTDDDNDGCLDGADDKPKQASSVVGGRVAVNCPQEMRFVYGWDGEDTDHDGRRNCADDDDDGDGTLDAADPCPIHKGTDASICQAPPTSCPVQKYQDVCQLGGCREFEIRVVSRVNPVWVVSNFILLESLVVLIPDGEQTVETVETAVLDKAQVQVVESGKRPAAARVSKLRGPRKVRLEIWSKSTRRRPGRLVATIAEYDPRLATDLKGTGRSALLLTVADNGRISFRRADAPRVEPVR